MTIRNLTRAALAGAALLGLATAGTASAQTRGALPQLSEITTDLGQNASAVTYWITQRDGWRVVTTVDSVVGDPQSAESRHAVVRFTAIMQPGQSHLVSVPGAVGAPLQALRIRRVATGSS